MSSIIRQMFNQIFLARKFSKRFNILKEKIKLYNVVTDEVDIYQYQLTQFNKIWSNACQNSPFYKWWKDKHELPSQLESLEELKRFPILTKSIINQKINLITSGLSNYYMTSTGGTSGVTTHFPTSHHDADVAYANAYLGRSWWDIKPFSRILMFWGHSHLFGTGLKGYFKKAKRKLEDYIINTKRISSYSLSHHNVKKFFEAIQASKAETIISYTSNLFKICKYMQAEDIGTPMWALNNVILTSETALDKDVDLFRRLFNANIIHEYGMAETGVIAYSYDVTDNIRVLWDSFVVQTDKDGRLYLTTIHDKIFPLINYDSEDWVNVSHAIDSSVLYLKNIQGKARDVLELPSVSGEKMSVSTILFDHVLKYYPGIYSVHYKQESNGATIYLSSTDVIDQDQLRKYMSLESSKAVPGIDFTCINILQGDEIKTIAGKRKVLIE